MAGGDDVQTDEPATMVTQGVATSATGVTPPPPDAAPDAVPDAATGARRYALGELLGRGGMGDVLSARDTQLDRTVAVKRLRADAPTPDLVARFLHEATIQARLDHPAIVPVHEAWTDASGVPAFAMKQLAGTTLAKVIAGLAEHDGDTARTFTRQRLLRAFADVCLAIEFAHRRGVVHRDLKPANIALGEFGEVYVLDWGIARVVDEPDAPPPAGTALGTPGYMSPEQLYGAADLDGRSDVYALGSILFELLAAQPLHPRSAAVPSTMTGIDARPSRRAPDANVAPELDAICVRATALARDDRHPSARSLGDEVRRYLDGDRDVALRKQLARAELDAAQASVASLGVAEARSAAEGRRVGSIARDAGAASRQEAFRAAGRALALDPSSAIAAQLVAKLMLSPPDDTPPEVDAAIRRLDDDALFAHRRITIAVMVAYLAFWPILIAAGLRPPWFLLGGAAVCVATAASVWVVPRRRVELVAWLSLAGNLAMLVLFSRLVGPFTASPGIAVIFAMTIGTHVRVARPAFLAVAICAAVLLPWALGILGVGPETTEVHGGALVLHTAASELSPAWASSGLVAYVVLLIGMAVFLTRLATSDRRAAQRALQIQAWQLRQLVPST